MTLQLAISAVVLLAISSAQAYHWPSPKFDAIEALLYELNPEPPESVSLVMILNKCTQTDNNASTAAEWLRFAYHDMATHNVDDGTGGLDASLYYELDRPENVGGGMTVTTFDFIDHPGKYITKSDIIAIGTVVAVAECGGPTIPLRYGRVDALAAGPPGVPEPQQDLASHTESFRRQGFNQAEMIGLVACGHTLGGVRFPDFPDIVAAPPEDPSNGGFPQDVIKTFDTTPAFDNAIVTEYLNGKTQNLLVTSPNKTVVSDFRIFSSDRNVTMKKMASPAAFKNTCQNLLERMINTVPRGVVLSDVVKPLPVKVDAVQLSVKNNSLNLHAMLRLSTANPCRKVTMLWENRTGGKCARNACSVQFYNTTDTTTELFRRAGMNPQKYHFDATINAAKSVSKFWFEVDEGNGKKPTVLDNGGTGYQIKQDFVLFDPARSMVTVQNFGGFDIVAAVKTHPAPSRVYAKVYRRVVPTSPSDAIVELSPALDIRPTAGYSFYKISLPRPDFMIDIFSVVNGKTYAEDGRNTHFVTGFNTTSPF